MKDKFSVVNHICYQSECDSGLRIYLSDDSYLKEHPSMYQLQAVFDTLEEAEEYKDKEDAEYFAYLDYLENVNQ